MKCTFCFRRAHHELSPDVQGDPGVYVEAGENGSYKCHTSSIFSTPRKFRGERKISIYREEIRRKECSGLWDTTRPLPGKNERQCKTYVRGAFGWGKDNIWVVEFGMSTIALLARGIKVQTFAFANVTSHRV